MLLQRNCFVASHPIITKKYKHNVTREMLMGRQPLAMRLRRMESARTMARDLGCAAAQPLDVNSSGRDLQAPGQGLEQVGMPF